MQHLIRNPEHLLFASVLSVISVSSYQCLGESLHFPRRNTGEIYVCVHHVKQTRAYTSALLRKACLLVLGAIHSEITIVIVSLRSTIRDCRSSFRYTHQQQEPPDLVHSSM